MPVLYFKSRDGLVTITAEFDVDVFALGPEEREQIFETVDELRKRFPEAADVPPPIRQRRKLRVVPEETPTPIRPLEAERPKIGDTRPAPDPRMLTKHLNGVGKIRWEDQIDFLFNGACDRIVREVTGPKMASNLKYFIQNKDRRVRVDVVTVDGVTKVVVRRREGGE
jgi:hypothetical protein